MKQNRNSDGVVTRASRRDKERAQNKHDHLMKKAIQREKPAYVRRAAAKEEAQHRVPAERLRGAIRQKRDPNRRLASEITRYVDRNGGEVQGLSLDDIYAEFALVLLDDASHQSLVLIGAAMQYAIGKSWLIEKEAEGCAFWVPWFPTQRAAS